MREKPRDKQRLQHILDGCNNILEFTNGIEYSEYILNKMLQFAVIKNFEIIGEAAYHLTKEFRDQNTLIPWDIITKFRHVLVHDYYAIDLDTVWRTVQSKIPELKTNIETIISQSNSLA